MATGKKDDNKQAGGKRDQEKTKFAEVKTKTNKSKLDSSVQDLVNFIFDQ